MANKVFLFDADGVLTVPEELFTRMYSRTHGLENEPFEQFFREQWQDIVTGKRDLKEAIVDHQELWQWQGTVDELVAYWCESEDLRHEPMIKQVRKLKQLGVPCYLATDQEKYRGNYMREVMFAGLFDDYFISAELGYSKDNPQFFEEVMKKLLAQHPELQPQDVVFFDDSQHKVDAAKSFGIDAKLFTTVEQFLADVQMLV